MANAQAFETGYNEAINRADQVRAHKQQMSDAEFLEKHNELQGNIQNLTTKLNSIDDKTSPDYLQAKDALAKAIQERNDHWHPAKNPGFLQKFGHVLAKDLHLPQKPAPTPVAPPVYGQSMMDLGGQKVATGPAYKVQGPQTTNQTKAQTEAEGIAAGAPPTPTQQAVEGVNVKNAAELADVQAKMANYVKLNPDSTPEDRQQYLNDLLQSTSKQPLGKWDRVQGKVNGKAVTLLFNEKNGEYRTEEGGSVPSEILNNFIADPKATGAGGKPIRAWQKDAQGRFVSMLVDPKTNQVIPGSQNYDILPPAYLIPKISTGVYHWVDENNQIHETPETRTSRPSLPGGGGGAAPVGAAPLNKYRNPEDQPPQVSYAFNKQFAKPGPYVTKLEPVQERIFQLWLHQQKPDVQREANSATSDYDVRGWWQATQQGDPSGNLTVSDFDGTMHGSDKWKTPYNGTFSNESIYAQPNAPSWQDNKLVTSDGKLVVDETPRDPGQLLNQAKKMAPKGAKAPLSPQGQGIKDKILGYKGSAPLNHANQVYSESVRITSLGDKLLSRAQEHPDDMAEADTQFVLSLIRSEAGRVNQQEIQSLFNAGGISEAPERWANRVGHGQLSPNLRQQLVDFTHDMKDASWDAVKSLKHDDSGQGGDAGGDSDTNDILKGLSKLGKGNS